MKLEGGPDEPATLTIGTVMWVKREFVAWGKENGMDPSALLAHLVIMNRGAPTNEA